MAGRNKKSSLFDNVKDLDVKEEKVVEPKSEPVVEKKEENDVPSKLRVEADPWLNVRNAPSFDSEVVGQLNSGDIVEIVEIKGEFVKISSTENKWVCIKFLIPVV